MTPATRRILLDVLAERFPDSSRATLRQMLQTDRIRVNGVPERNAKRPITAADRVQVGAKRRTIDPRVTILHEDADLIVIDKPSGLLTVPTAREAEDTVVALLADYLGAGRRAGRVHVVHRLDRAASGVLVFAKNFEMRESLKALFAEHDVDREYVAIVHGRLRQPAGTLRSWLAEDRSLRMKSVSPGRGGKEAVTHYRTLDAGQRYSLLEVTLETGRRNQIRVHLADAGHPIVGDSRYGAGRGDPLGRLGLHARKLAFRHPRTGRTATFALPIPDGFRELKL